MNRIFVTLLLCCMCFWAKAQLYHIGDVFTAPDGSRGIVFYLNPDGTGGWVVALNDASSGCQWGGNMDITELDNRDFNPNIVIYDTAGYVNTLVIRNAQNNNSSYAAGKVDFSHGWYLPSTGQLMKLYAQLPIVQSALIQAGGSTLSNAAYWCSAERNSQIAWGVDFGDANNNGGFSDAYKSATRRVRAVRSFTYQSGPEVSYLWSTGDTTATITVSPLQTTNYSVTVFTSDGCSDTVAHTIVVNSPVALTISDMACDSYTWNGTTYTEGGSYTQTFTAANGCDSTVTLNLTINNSTHTVTTLAQCESYIWHGTTYTSSGTYTYGHADDNGCTQVDTLHLTILGSPDATIIATSETICAGDEVTLQTQVSALSSGPVSHVPPVAIGDILCTDNSIVKPSAWPVAGKTAMGIVFYVDNTGEHGWAVHLQNQATGVQWGGYGTDISTLTNYTTPRDAITDMNGYSNTQKIRAAGSSATYPAAYLVDFSHGWYLPAAGQLRILVSEIVTLNTSLEIVGGTQIPMNSGWWYWTSTEYGRNAAWYVTFYASLNTVNKNLTQGVRSVRDF